MFIETQVGDDSKLKLACFYNRIPDTFGFFQRNRRDGDFDLFVTEGADHDLLGARGVHAADQDRNDVFRFGTHIIRIVFIDVFIV